MILLDTNVLSAVMQRDPPEAVVAWLDDQPASSIWTTAVTVFEIEYGLRRLPEGRRRRRIGGGVGGRVGPRAAGAEAREWQREQTTTVRCPAALPLKEEHSMD